MNLINETKVPEGWIKGQLLDLKRYGDGTFDAFQLGSDEKQARKNGQYISFHRTREAQEFISDWYSNR